MLCPYCKKEISDSSKFCSECGTTLDINEYIETKVAPKGGGYAIASFILCLVGLIPYCTLASLVAFVLGFCGLRSTKKGFAITGIIVSLVTLILGIVFIVVIIELTTAGMGYNGLGGLIDALEGMYY